MFLSAKYALAEEQEGMVVKTYWELGYPPEDLEEEDENVEGHRPQAVVMRSLLFP